MRSALVRHIRLTARFIVAASLVLQATACAGDGPGRSTAAAGLPLWAVDDQPVLVVGLEERTSDHIFGRVADATYLDDGAIAVLESGTRQVRAFDSEGDLLWVAGGRGEGPGEFSWDVSVLRRNADGTIAVPNGDNRSVVVFEPTGAYSHTDRIESANPLQPITTLHPPFDDGAVALVHRPITLLPSEPGFERYSRPVTVTLQSDSGDARFEFPDAEAFTLLGAGRPLAGVLPFAHVPSIAVGGKFIAAGVDPDSITIVSSQAEQWRIPVSLVRSPVDAAAIEGFLSLRESRRSELEEVLRRVQVPDSTPRYDRLAVDSEDRIWVRQHALDDATAWEVLDAAGSRLARARIPPGVRIIDARDDEVLLLHRTDLGVEYVARWSLTEVPGGARD